ncbi:hypothetical protein FB45DRAFT_85264 [Roridomyces roridus]|uniref:Uncharacterized protein n=1 Tax=Roridomyces roridus TaxID=1738132 RepID=A0AAD7BM33_9AGAR|nr:hypothetical protein FB45DRAFT_85264 [Roridomyces roridus]
MPTIVVPSNGRLITAPNSNRPVIIPPGGPDLQKLFICLSVVAAFVAVTSFGVVKLVALMPGRSRVEKRAKKPFLLRLSRPASYNSITTTTIANLRKPTFVHPRKARPAARDFCRGAVKYVKVSPHVRHITAPNAYAMNHRRRTVWIHPGSSPLRNVVEPGCRDGGRGRWAWIMPITLLGRRGGCSAATSVGALLEKEGQEVVEAEDDDDDDDEPLAVLLARSKSRSTYSQPPAIPSAAHETGATPDTWPWTESLHHAADIVVGAHPDTCTSAVAVAIFASNSEYPTPSVSHAARQEDSVFEPDVPSITAHPDPLVVVGTGVVPLLIFHSDCSHYRNLAPSTSAHEANGVSGPPKPCSISECIPSITKDSVLAVASAPGGAASAAEEEPEARKIHQGTGLGEVESDYCHQARSPLAEISVKFPVEEALGRSRVDHVMGVKIKVKVKARNKGNGTRNEDGY